MTDQRSPRMGIGSPHFAAAVGMVLAADQLREEIKAIFEAPRCECCGKRIGTPDEWEGLPDDRLDDRCWAEPGNCAAGEPGRRVDPRRIRTGDVGTGV